MAPDVRLKLKITIYMNEIPKYQLQIHFALKLKRTTVFTTLKPKNLSSEMSVKLKN